MNEKANKFSEVESQKTKIFTFIAHIISRIFGFLTVIWLGLIFLFSGRFSKDDFIWILVSVLFFSLMGIILFIMVKLKIVKDIDLTERKERPLLLFFMILVGLILLFLFITFEVNLVLRYLIVIYLVEMLFNFLITLFWKISNHALWTTTLVLWGIILLGSQYLPLIVIIPIVFWARWYLKKHTITQLIAGTLLAFLTILPLARIFHLI